MFLSATDRVMRGKKGTSGVHIMKTVQAIIVCVYHEPIVAEQVNKAAEKVHLILFVSISVCQYHGKARGVPYWCGLLDVKATRGQIQQRHAFNY